MNWYKYSQNIMDASENIENIETPNVIISPYEEIIQESVNELQSEQPGILDNISNINVDTGYGQFGSVTSAVPNTININLNKIKNEISQQLGRGINFGDPSDQDIVKNHIKQIIIHEVSHVHDYDPETGEFPGGELVAEKAQQEWTEANPLQF